ncbi:heavy metal translocating P-type ATPase [Brachyspira pilosicoli]|uniref:P-type Zn(2+) transporter n=2 Tax=Brachyspira pilosicoli TaxID=52584 RepID=A0A3B6VJB5_BRAPL|nr:heavy metal translocating P-type ATPase [Brachyspira pilosicoli]AGA66000.1 cadmium translocating P-type ATPase [Brachyspira pilosicoli P43/6/78]MBW5392874.1 cadmium-translocating P-type ATPase [Brachyspira pilosicoli]WIH81728.1 cadmium-translocating P-type ATPase [Brachyspira pilosicoli]WIH90997.1 cadmium-translocating P-type ATPase [Brachyspira pilosicoli]WIH93288.1 cadmium-translocating P-type ATPase [Brachyspira pilosicoli]
MSKNKEKILFISEITISLVVLILLNALHNKIHGVIEYIIFFIPYFILGRDVFKNAVLDFVKGKFMRESFLMSIATVGAIILHQLPEALAVLLFYRIGEYFEDMAVDKSKRTIAALMSIRADFANIIKEDGTIEKVDISKVNINDNILINPFEKVPLDSIIYEGESWLDTKALTGESMPKDVKVNDEILAGTINGESSIKARVIRVYAESSIAKILKLVRESQNRKANIEQFITKFAGIYTPIVVFGAILLTIIPTIIYGKEFFNDWFARSLTLLVVSCPCAFMVGIPLTYFASIGRASKFGIMVKGGVFLDLLAQTKKVIFDKTGTLTKGKFYIREIENAGIYDDDTLIKYASLAEIGSSHPIAISIVEHYKKNHEINESLITSHKDIRGKGSESIIEGKSILIGKLDLLKQNNIKLPDNINNKFNVYISIDGEYAGAFYIDDIIKDDTKEAIDLLNSMNIETALISGDNIERVTSFAKENNIQSFSGGCLPEEKVNVLEGMMKDSKVSIFVGDGINDAPSLARADIGIAMGGLGSDAAIENADVIIMDDKPSKVAAIIKLAKKNHIVVLENILLALVIKFGAIILGALGLASIALAIFADTGVTVIVVLNALRLLYPIGEKSNIENVSPKDIDIKVTSCNCGHHH